MEILNVQTEKQSLKNVSDVKIFDLVNAYGCNLGNNTKVGAFVEIQKKEPA